MKICPWRKGEPMSVSIFHSLFMSHMGWKEKRGKNKKKQEESMHLWRWHIHTVCGLLRPLLPISDRVSYSSCFFSAKPRCRELKNLWDTWRSWQHTCATNRSLFYSTELLLTVSPTKHLAQTRFKAKRAIFSMSVAQNARDFRLHSDISLCHLFSSLPYHDQNYTATSQKHLQLSQLRTSKAMSGGIATRASCSSGGNSSCHLPVAFFQVFLQALTLAQQ